VVLKGKVSLVTGASQGIGRATAVALAQAGSDVAINYFNHREEAEKVAEEVQRAGARSLLLPGDVSDNDVVERMVSHVVAHFGHLDIAVTNAVYADRGLFHQLDLAAFRRTIDVTMWGALYTLRAATRQMIHQAEGGSIVVISSPHAVIAVPRSMPYNMSKAAIDHMARTAAIELVDYRIRVNVIHPGWIDTPGERKFATDEQIAEAGQKLPWKRLGTSEEIARGVVFLCDPASDYITGTTLGIDGGATLPWWAARGSAVPD
jgi:glucose 1-dehydrogenase